MPAIMRMSCNHCDYAKEGSQSVTLAIRTDGSEVVCGHPVERMIAEKATGESWKDLVRQRRIRYRFGLVCLNCGELGYYGPDQLGHPPRRATHIVNVVSSVTTKEAGRYSCTACGLAKLYPLMVDLTQREIAREFVNWLRGLPNGPICPKCRAGRLRSYLVAVS